MARVGEVVLRDDYVEIRDLVVSILGSGVAQRGYGQPVLSESFNPVGSPNGTKITRSQWLALRTDITNIVWHQTGNLPSLANVTAGSVIRFGNNYPVPSYKNIIDAALTSRFDIGPVANRSNVITIDQTSSPWSGNSTASLTVIFNNANEARWFFNSGGKIQFRSFRTGSPSTLNNVLWDNFLNQIGTVSFGGNVPTLVNFYSLTTQNQTVGNFILINVENFYSIKARCNLADNNQGGATEITFDFEWKGTEVDGIISLVVSELKAEGPFIQGGTFTVASPSTYTLSSITDLNL